MFEFKAVDELCFSAIMHVFACVSSSGQGAQMFVGAHVQLQRYCKESEEAHSVVHGTLGGTR